MSDNEDLLEMFKSSGWQFYLLDCEETMVTLFRQMFFLDPSKPESFIKFVELKSRLDQLRDATYSYERSLSEDMGAVDEIYSSRFREILRKIWRKP